MTMTYSIPTKRTGKKPRPRSWKWLSKKQKRIAIAMDAIKWLGLVASRRETGPPLGFELSVGSGYVEGYITNDLFKEFRDSDGSCMSKDLINTLKSDCTMCARGFLMVARLDVMGNGEPRSVRMDRNSAWSSCTISGRQTKNFSVNESDTVNNMPEFSKKEQGMFEAIFEGDMGYIHSNANGCAKLRDDCRKWRDHFVASYARKVEQQVDDCMWEMDKEHHLDGNEQIVYAMCQNVIDNDGTFDPTDLYECA